MITYYLVKGFELNQILSAYHFVQRCQPVCFSNPSYLPGGKLPAKI